MFLVMGLVLGLLVGLATSLIRFRAMPRMLVASNVLSVLVVVATILIALFSAKSGGDAFIAWATLVIIMIVGAICVVIVSLLLGLVLSRVNGFSFAKNARTVICDVVLLGVALMFFYGTIFNAVHESEKSKQDQLRHELALKVKGLIAELPKPYNALSGDEPRGLYGQLSRREITLAPEVASKLKQIVDTQDAISDSFMHPYQEDNARRATTNQASLFGWLFAAVGFPIILRRKQKMPAPAPSPD